MLERNPHENENAHHDPEGREVFLADWRSANEQNQAPDEYR
jgi:hypothetical protein